MGQGIESVGNFVSVYCPSCNRILYNRRLKKCGFCGALLPENLRFSPEEIAKIEKMEKELERSEAERRKRADQEEEAQRNAVGDIGPIDFGGSS
jgi:hypothetical protein